MLRRSSSYLLESEFAWLAPEVDAGGLYLAITAGGLAVLLAATAPTATLKEAPIAALRQPSVQRPGPAHPRRSLAMQLSRMRSLTAKRAERSARANRC